MNFFLRLYLFARRACRFPACSFPAFFLLKEQSSLHLWCPPVMFECDPALSLPRRFPDRLSPPFKLKQQFTVKEAGIQLKNLPFGSILEKNKAFDTWPQRRVDCSGLPTNNPELPSFRDEPSIWVQKENCHPWTLEQSAFMNSGCVITRETGGSE